MAQTIPLTSHEVRWFFEGKVDQYDVLKHWFMVTAPFPKSTEIGPPLWKGRLDDQPDIYMLVPGVHDMGIKWREGELQIKGRLSILGTQVFCGRHMGNIERWIKWSYPNLPTAYQRLFDKGEGAELVTIAVKKTRALRKLRLDTLTGRAEEVDIKTLIDRGIVIELTDLVLEGTGYCSLAFEAFPNDSAIDTAFTQAVEAFVDSLTEIDLLAAKSQSYPAFLATHSSHK